MLNGQIILIIKHATFVQRAGQCDVLQARLQESLHFLYLSVFRLFAFRLQLRFPPLAAIRTFRREFKPVFFKTIFNIFFLPLSKLNEKETVLIGWAPQSPGNKIN